MCYEKNTNNKTMLLISFQYMDALFSTLFLILVSGYHLLAAIYLLVKSHEEVSTDVQSCHSYCNLFKTMPQIKIT